MLTHKSIRSLSILGVSAWLLASLGCSTSGITVREGAQNAGIEAAQAAEKNSAILVHVDKDERIVTIRNGASLDSEFMAAYNARGQETALLKVRKPGRFGSLKTAEILEGNPSINDIVISVAKEREDALAKIYRD